MMELEGATVVAIDDTASIRTFLQVSLEDEGAEFYGAASAAEGLELCANHAPDIVVLDLGLGDRDGLEILPEIKQSEQFTPRVMVLSVRKNRETINQAYKNGADAYLFKPFMVDDLLDILREF